MAESMTRRSVLKSGAAAGALAALGWPDWLLPALAQGETLVPFTDVPANFSTNPSEMVRVLDIRRIDAPITPRDQFFTLQHYGQPDVDPAKWRLSIDGLVDRPIAI
jgi:DMSO/TMAO reductase YedYZ molybdopterin-dependent catalytic subunit